MAMRDKAVITLLGGSREDSKRKTASQYLRSGPVVITYSQDFVIHVRNTTPLTTRGEKSHIIITPEIAPRGDIQGGEGLAILTAKC